jgi:hypothetical protein
MRFLDQYFDPAMDIDTGLLPDTLAEQEVERLQDCLSIALVAGQIPRRLSDASREELALDKKRSRRVAHVLRQSLTSWDGELAREPTTEERQRGAQIDWPGWWADHEPWLVDRRRFYATWAKMTSQLKFGREGVVKLSNELDWLRYAMRD